MGPAPSIVTTQGATTHEAKRKTLRMTPAMLPRPTTSASRLMKNTTTSSVHRRTNARNTSNPAPITPGAARTPAANDAPTVFVRPRYWETDASTSAALCADRRTIAITTATMAKLMNATTASARPPIVAGDNGAPGLRFTASSTGANPASDRPKTSTSTPIARISTRYGAAASAMSGSGRCRYRLNVRSTMSPMPSGLSCGASTARMLRADQGVSAAADAPELALDTDSDRPSRRWRRASGPGAHQLRSPRRRIVAGTTRARTSVASIATARAIPRPMALMSTMSASPNAAKTPTMIAAAPVMSRPLFSRPIATERCVVVRFQIFLLDPRQKQHLVVHRETKDRAEHDHRQGRVDRTRRESELCGEVSVLEDPDQRPERRGDRKKVHDDGLERQDYRSKEEEEHEHRRRHDVRERGGGVAGDEVHRVEIDRGESRDRDGGISWCRKRSHRAHEMTGLVTVDALLR